MFFHHLVAMHKKPSSRVTLLRRIVGLGWGTGVKTLSKAALSPVYLTTEYCTPIWFVALTRALYLDSVLNLCQLGATHYLAYH